MIHQQIKELFFSSVEHIVSDISQYAVHPDSDFKRSKKIPAQKLISFLVSQGSSSTRVEIASYWSGAIRKKFWQTSTQKVTYALLIRQLLSITLNMEVMIHMSCPSVFYASLSALLHTSAS